MRLIPLAGLFLVPFISACEQVPTSAVPIAFDRNEVCSSQTQSPVCVAKSLEACRAPSGNPEGCGAIGVKNTGERWDMPGLDASPLTEAPWAMTWDAIADAQYTCGYTVAAVEKVASDRFEADPPLREELVGTHELVLIDNRCLGERDVKSLFMKQGPSGWSLVSFYDWGVSWDGSTYGSMCERNNPFVNAYAMCDMRAVGIKPYAITLPEIDQVVPDFGTVFPPEMVAQSCVKEAGQKRANLLAIQCRVASGATHPPCHPMNSCQMMVESITQDCAYLSEQAPKYNTVPPDFCKDYKR